MTDKRLCVPCSNGRCERCDGETRDGACGCHCGGKRRPAGPTPSVPSVEEARRNVRFLLHDDVLIDALIAAALAQGRREAADEFLEKLSEDPESAVAAQMARSSTLAEVVRVVEGMEGLTATVSAYSSWSEGDEAPRHHPELEGVYFIRRSDVLSALAALKGTT